MLTFACRRIEMCDVVRCSFGLTKAEHTVLLSLLARPGTASEVAGRLGMDRTGAQKALAGLAGKRLASREKRNLPGGGFSFRYHPADRRRLRAEMKAAVKSWSAGVCRAIDGWK